MTETTSLSLSMSHPVSYTLLDHLAQDTHAHAHMYTHAAPAAAATAADTRPPIAHPLPAAPSAQPSTAAQHASNTAQHTGSTAQYTSVSSSTPTAPSLWPAAAPPAVNAALQAQRRRTQQTHTQYAAPYYHHVSPCPQPTHTQHSTHPNSNHTPLQATHNTPRSSVTQSNTRSSLTQPNLHASLHIHDNDKKPNTRASVTQAPPRMLATDVRAAQRKQKALAHAVARHPFAAGLQGELIYVST